MQLPKKFLILTLYLVLQATIFASLRVKCELKSGAVVSGTVLKETNDYLLVDLGYDALRIPMDECNEIIRLKTTENSIVKTSQDLFSVQSAPSSGVLGDMVEGLGSAVVMIRTPVGLGSGFFIHQDGYVVTNDHVVAGERKISITQFSRSKDELLKINYDKVRIVATGGNLDLALLKIEDQPNDSFPFVSLGDSNKLRQGERVFAIGSPLGLERSVSEGIISLRNRIVQSRLHIQTTAEISPGNSGGPLFNYKGEVIGVNNMKVVSQGAEGLGFAIPVQTLKGFLRNRDAYAFDPRNPNAGFLYLSPPIDEPVTFSK